jgi:parallel beta-helix repeat protein
MLNHNTANRNTKNAICSFYSSNNQIYGNQFQGNGIRLIGQSLSDFIQEITADNMIDGRPIYYYKHQNSIDVPPDAAQVILVNSSFMNISNCNLANGTIGISLFFSHHNTLSHNTANCNENKDDECGIYLYHSNNNTLNQNTANYNGEYGIFLEQSSNNTLINNIANYNTQYGLFLEQSSNNMLNNNTIIQNGNSGIYLLYSSNNRIYKNQFYRNGIELRGWNPSDFIEEITPDNEINGRPIYYYKYQKALAVPTDAAQVILINCSYMTILRCNVSEGTIGISLFFSHGNMIFHNIANHNNLHGIYSFQSNNNTLTYNTANQNGKYGFYLEFSSNNMLIHNTANQNSIGIYIVSDNNVELELYLGPTIETSLFPPGRNIVSHNIVNHNKYYGIILLHTDENTLSYNTVDDNGYGICLEKADDTLISFNVINKNEYGIYLWSSFNNKITRNTLYNNSHCICEICSWCNTIENNDCSAKFNAETPQIPGFIWTFVISGLIITMFLKRAYSKKE